MTQKSSGPSGPSRKQVRKRRSRQRTLEERQPTTEPTTAAAKLLANSELRSSGVTNVTAYRHES